MIKQHSGNESARNNEKQNRKAFLKLSYNIKVNAFMQNNSSYNN